MAILVQIKNLFIFLFVKNFFKILLVIILSIILFLSLFPKNELSDFVSKTVAEQTNYQMKLDFEDLSFALLNNMGVQLDKVFFEMAGRPPITLKELIASPDIMAAINRKPYGRMKMTGLFSGHAEIKISKHKPETDISDKKVEQSAIAIAASKVDLMGLKSFLNLPIEMRGQADLNALAISIFQFEPPSADVSTGSTQAFQLLGIPELTLTIKNFEMPPFLLERGLPLPMNVPGLKFSEIVLKGRLYENIFQIQELTLGLPNDELSGTIKGNLTLLKGPVPLVEKYEFTTDLKMRQSFHDKISLFLPILNANRFIIPFNGGYNFKSKVYGRANDMPLFDSAR